jgi:hypothetical protein
MLPLFRLDFFPWRGRAHVLEGEWLARSPGQPVRFHNGDVSKGLSTAKPSEQETATELRKLRRIDNMGSTLGTELLQLVVHRHPARGLLPHEFADC